MGVEVATKYTPIISSLVRIVEKLIILKEKLINSKVGDNLNKCVDEILSTSGRSRTLLLDGLRKNEVSASNLEKAHRIVETLKKELTIGNQTINLFSSIDGNKYNYSARNAFKKIMIEDVSLDKKVKLLGSKDNYNRLLALNLLGQDLKVFEKTTLKRSLDSLVRGVFDHVRLVLVHEQKGFKPMNTVENIYCNRITSGAPRCKVL